MTLITARQAAAPNSSPLSGWFTGREPGYAGLASWGGRRHFFRALVALGLLGLIAPTAQADVLRPYAVTASGQYNATDYAAARLIDPAANMPQTSTYWRLDQESASALHPAGTGSDSKFGQWINATGLVGTNWVKFQLGPALGGGSYAQYNLTKIYLWQGYQTTTTLTNRGIKDFGLWVSTNNGANYYQVGGKRTLVQCPKEGVSSSGLYSIAQPFDLITNGVTHVMLTVSNNFGGDNYLTLSEVRFEATGPSTSLTWSGGAGGNAWDLNTTANWNGGAAKFVTGAGVTFDDTSANTGVTLSGLLQPWNVTVTAAQTYSFTGSGTFSTIGGPNDNTWTLNGPGAVILSPTANVTNGSPLVGAGPVVVQGGYATTLSGDNSGFYGGFTLAGGTLKLGSATALGTVSATTVITNGGTLDLGGLAGAMNNPVIVSGSGMSGSNAITSSAQIATPFVGLRYVTLAGDTVLSTPTRWDIGNGTSGGALTGNGYQLTYTGTNSGSLNYLGETDLGNIVLSNATLYIQGNTTLGRPASNVIVNAGSSLNFFNATVAPTKNLILNGGSLACGAATINYAGNVTLAANSSVAGGTLTTISGLLSGTGTLTNASGKLMLTATNSTFSPLTVISGGTLQLGDGSAANGSVAGNILDNATLVFANAFNQTYTGLISGNGAVTVNAGNSAILTLGNANTFTNGTTVTAGTLQLGVANALPGGPGVGNVTVNGTLDLSGFSPTINGLGGSGVVDNVSAGGAPNLTIGGNNASSAFSGVLQNTTGSLGLTKIGSGTNALLGANTLAGPVTIAAGTLIASNATALGSATVTVNTNAVLALGPLGITGANTLTLANHLTLQGGSTLRLRVGGNPLSGNDRIAGAVNVTLNDISTILFDGMPATGVPYTVVTYSGTLTGSAANLTGAVVNVHGVLTPTFDTTSQPGAILVTFSGSAVAANLVWRGDGPPTNSWQVGVVSNWYNGSSLDQFYQGDAVTFNDTVSSTNRLRVTVGANGVAPSSVVVNSTNTYYLQGGPINTPLLVKTNTGWLALVGPANLASLQVAQGIVYPQTAALNLTNVIVSAGGEVYAVGALTYNNPGGLVLNGSGPAGLGALRQGGATNGIWNGPITLGTPSLIYVDANATLTLPGVVGGNGPLSLGGGTSSKTVLLASGNAWTNGTLINSGTALQIGTNDPTGSLGTGTLTNNGALNFLTTATLAVTNEIRGAGTLNNNAWHQLSQGGRIVLSGVNTFLTNTVVVSQSAAGQAGTPGAAAMDGAVIQAAANNALGSGTLTIGQGQLDASRVELSGGITLTNPTINCSVRAIDASYNGVVNPPHLVNVSGTNTIGPGNDILIPTGGNLVCFESVDGLFIYARNVVSAGPGRAFALRGAGNGLFLGAIRDNGANTVSVFKDDAGTWTLAGTNTYSLPTSIRGGTLALGANGSLASSEIRAGTTAGIGSGAIFDVSAAPGGWSLPSGQTIDGCGQVNGLVKLSGGVLSPGLLGSPNTVGTLTLASHLNVNGGVIKIGLDSYPAGNHDLLAVQGDLNLTNGGVQVTLLNGPLADGTYKLITFGGNLNGSINNLVLQGVPGGALVRNGNEIDLVYVTPTYITWLGDGAGNLWDIGASLCWTTNAGASRSVFANGEVVTFDDAGSANPIVNLPGVVRPGGIVLNNTSDYTLTGAGRISGSTYLSKGGAGALILNCTNDFNGGVQLNGGTVVIPWLANGGVASPLGASSSAGLNWVVGGPVWLRYTGPTTSSDRGIIWNNASQITVEVTNAASVLTFGGSLSGGLNVGDVLTKDGPGALVLSGPANNWGVTSGTGTTVANGTLQLGNGGTTGWLGLGATVLASTNSVLAVNRSDTVALTLYNSVTGPGRVLQLGPGRLETQQTMSYTGGTTIDSGVLAINSGFANDPNNTITVNGGALAFDVRNDTFGNSQAAVVIPIVINAGAVVSNYNRFNTLGPLTLNGGTLAAFGGANATAQAFCLKGTVTVGGTVTSHMTAQGTNAATLIGGGSVSNVVFDVAHHAADTDLEISAALVDGVNASSVAQPSAIAKLGPGKLVLDGTNTYSGGTVVSNGTLLVNGPGSITNGVTVAGGTFGGTGTVAGDVVVLSGATLSPGASIGTLTVTKSLTLQEGGTTYLELDGSTLAADQLTGLSSVTYGGTLVLTNLGGTTALTNGAQLKLFAAASYVPSSFTATNLPALPAGLLWDASFLAIDGTLRVKSAVPPQPYIATVGLDGAGNLVFGGTNGTPGGGYTVLSSANVADPLASWLTNSAGNFDGAGAFRVTNALNPALPREFFLLRVP